MRVITVTILAAALGIGACGGEDVSSPPPPGERVAATPQIRFDPATVTIKRGASVTWNFGAVPHNVTFNAVAGRPEDISGQNINLAVSRIFTQTGTFPYACTIHPGMTGSVTVSESVYYLVSP